jgi:hypothetical protein
MSRLTPEEKSARAESRKVARVAAKHAARIAAERAQPRVASLTISVEWKKSRTWGHNPHASVRVLFADGTSTYRDGFTCSGCGYDKASTVVGEVFDTFLRYKLWEERGGTAPYGLYQSPLYRSFGHGIGMSCYPSIAEFIGGAFETVASGDSFDVYRYTDGR